MSADKLNSIISDPVKRVALEKRFWSKVDRRGNDECWPWTAKAVISSLKYGALNITGTVTGSHRVAYALSNGGIDDNVVIRHSCDNPSCCNPRHLLSGTQADNHKDMMDRERHVSVFRDPNVRQKAQETKRKNPRVMPEAEKEAKRQLMKRRWDSPEWRQRFSEIMSGPGNPLFGRPNPRKPGVTEKIVATRKAKGYRHSEETKERMRQAALKREAAKKKRSES